MLLGVALAAIWLFKGSVWIKLGWIVKHVGLKITGTTIMGVHGFLPLQTELETPDIERTRTFVASPTESFCHSSAAVIVKQRTSPDDRSPSSVSIAIRHTDV
ncbi:hypothetical protein AVEN_195435-1 [Araneus ventricosus]|uniref:Uncharacterized protein n=1 Tax=Araneus ventricosus TaxID=182803 RepID=A0A4Y2TV88_ARAVE|nr:hypothetical protein AVEN_195435-1 [Araneus ventricosus]